MANNAIELHIAEHGLVTTIETLIASPEQLGTTEADVTSKLRIVAQILTISEEATTTVATAFDALKRLTDKP